MRYIWKKFFMNKDKEKSFIRRNWIECIVLSVFIHFIVLYFLVGDSFLVKYLPLLGSKPMEVYAVDADEFEQQFVSIDDQEGDKSPNPNARYLSRVNKKVDIETRASQWGKPKNRNNGVRAILEQDVDEAINSYMAGRRKASKRMSSGDGNESGESTTYDYLPGIKPGDKTYLNTAEFVYYSFYRRVQEPVVYLWNKYVSDYIEKHPDVKKNLGNKDYITEVEATLTDSGAFVRIAILKSSGISGIDDAPGRAFLDAGPFENPPKGMIESDGLVRMKWRFIVSVVESVRYGVEEINPFTNNDGWPDPAFQRETWR